MSRVRAIQVRLTKQQHERIRADSTFYGFPSVSAYLRYLALARHQLLEEKIIEMHRILTGGMERGRGKRKPLRPMV